MNRDKQIDEMRNDVEHIHRCFLEDDYDHFDEYIAVRLFEKGYRKADEVAREVLALVWDAYQTSYNDAEFEERLDELKKKYAEG